MFVSVLGSEKKRSASMSGARRAHGVLQARIARELRLKRTPTLTFEYDHAVEHGVRMSKLIDELAPEDETTTQADLGAVVEAIRGAERFLVTTHENPDGDALGSLLATQLALTALGKDSLMFLPGPAPLPGEYRFLPLERAAARAARRRGRAHARRRRLRQREPARRRCGRAARGAVHAQHRPSPRQLALRRRQPRRAPTASSTGEVLRDVFAELGVELTPELAEPLYVALVTDTGRFQYANTTPKALRLAAELVEAGRRRAQGLPGRLRERPVREAETAGARARAGSGYEGGGSSSRTCFATTSPRSARWSRTRRGSSTSSAPSRAPSMAALIREPPRGGAPARRISLRASHDELDVSAIARESGGGGHRQAAGFSSDDSIDEITDFLRREFVAARACRALMPPRASSRAGSSSSTSRPGLRRSRSSPGAPRTGAKTGHAGTLDPFATGLLLLFSGRATKLARSFVGLDKRYLTDVDLHVPDDDGRSGGRRRRAARAAVAGRARARLAGLRGEIELPIPAASAVKIGGERAYKLHRRGVAVEMPLRRSRVDALDVIAYTDGIAALDLRVSSGTYVRAIAEALGGHCVTLRRTRDRAVPRRDGRPGARRSRPSRRWPLAELARHQRDGRALAGGARRAARGGDRDVRRRPSRASAR